MSFSTRVKSVMDGGSKKVMIVVGLVVVGALAFIMLRDDTPPPAQSTLPQGPTTVAVQGAGQITPNYDSALAAADRRRAEEARASNSSSVPTIRPERTEAMIPISVAPPAPVDAPVVTELEEEPEPIRQAPVIIQQQPTPTPFVAQQMSNPQNDEQVRELARYMENMRSVAPIARVERWAVTDPVVEEVVPAAEVVASEPEQPSELSVALPSPGTILYAELVGRANSDAPGPVLANVIQGPLAGSRLIGSFDTRRDTLSINFDRLVVPADPTTGRPAQVVDVEVVAVDPSTVGTGMATSVDRHLASKLAFGFTSAFARGFGEALARSGSTVTQRTDGSVTTSTEALAIEDQLLSAGGHAIGEGGRVLQQEFGDRPTTIIVEAGTPLGLLFL